MAEQQLRRDPALPRSIGIWGDELRAITLPEESFDPAGAWSQRYSIYILGPFDKQWRGAFRRAGALCLERTPTADGGFTQTGRRVEQMICKTWLSTAWKAEYAGDPPATPRAWTFTSDMLFNWRPVDVDFRYADIGPASYRDRPLPIKSTRYKFTGRLEGEKIINEGCSPIDRAPGTALATNWGLFDAVQRLDPGLAQPLVFDMLQDFDLHKPGQTLRSGGTVDVEFARGPVRLHGFHQLGHGVLPYEYWVDDEGRLVLAVGGYQGYVLNPDEPIGDKLS